MIKTLMLIVTIAIFINAYHLNGNSNAPQFENIDFYVFDCDGCLKHAIMFEKYTSISKDKLNKIEIPEYRGVAKDYLIDVYNVIGNSIDDFYNLINRNFIIESVTLNLNTDKSMKIEYIDFVDIRVDLNEKEWFVIIVEIDYGFSHPVKYSENIDLDNYFEMLLKYNVRNVFQSLKQKPVPVPDALESDLPDTLHFPNWDDIDVFRKKENQPSK